MNPRTPKLVILIGAVVGVMLSTILTAGEPLPAETMTIEQAIERLDQTIAQSGASDPESVQEAAAVLGYALDANQIQTAEGHLALANAYFIGEDLGRSITHYRKGLAIDPHHKELRANLAHARSFVEPTLPNEGQPLTLGTALLSWQYLLSNKSLWLICLTLGGLASALWTVMILTSRIRIPRTAPISCAALCITGLVLMGYAGYQSNSEHAVVVGAPETRMYSGPGTGVYQEVYEGPLGIGTEAVVLSIENQWAKIKLANDQEGWIDAGSLLYINDTLKPKKPSAAI